MSLSSSLRRAAALGLALAAGPIWAQETVCSFAITALPAVISAPGTYCLKADLATSAITGAAISIESDGVVLDLKGFTLDGPALPTAFTVGVRVLSARQVTVRNGTVRGFQVGVGLQNAAAEPAFFLVERVRAVGNSNLGIRVASAGQNVVRDNTVLGTGGFDNALPACIGIDVTGAGSRLEGNLVSGLVACPAGGTRAAIQVSSCVGCLVQGNELLAGAVLANSEGVQVLSPDVLVVDNRVTRFATGLFFTPGGASSRYRDNLTAGCTTAFSGGTNAGNNQ
jgi:hypothetical protein